MQLNIWVFADKKYNWVSLFGEELSWSKSHRRLIIDHAAAGIHLEYWSSCVLCNRFITTSNHFRTFLWISSGREPAVVIRLLFIVSQSGRWAGQDGAVTVSAVRLSAGLALSMVTPPATLWHCHTMSSLIQSYLLSCPAKTHDVIETSDDDDDNHDSFDERLAGANTTTSVRLNTQRQIKLNFYFLSFIIASPVY